MVENQAEKKNQAAEKSQSEKASTQIGEEKSFAVEGDAPNWAHLPVRLLELDVDVKRSADFPENRLPILCVKDVDEPQTTN